MSEFLTTEQIYEKYVSEWVLLADPQLSDQQQVLGGRVLSHGKDRAEVYREGFATKTYRTAMLYTGTIPEGMAVVL